MKGRILTLDSAEKPWCLENPKFSGDQITLPTSQKRVYGLFKASFFDCTIKFFAAFEKVRVFQQNRLLRRDPNLREEFRTFLKKHGISFDERYVWD